MKTLKVLIVKTSSLGDVIHTLPALTDAKANIPEVQFSWVVEESFAEIPNWHPAVVKVIPVAWRRWRKNLKAALLSGEIFHFLATLRQEKYDLIIDAQGLIKSAIIAAFAFGVRCGYAKNSVREPQAAYFYKNKYEVAKNQHAITRSRQLFALSLHYTLPPNAPHYGINEKIFPQTEKHEKYMVFFHGTSKAEKCWSEQKWIELAEFAVANGFIVYLPWGDNNELLRSKRIAAEKVQVRVLPKLKLAAIAALIRSASGVVAVDTGLSHMAAAFDIPTISLYGVTNPELIGTVGANQVHLANFGAIEAADVWQVMKNLLSSEH